MKKKFVLLIPINPWANHKKPGGVTGNTSEFESDILSSNLSMVSNMLTLA